VRLFFAIEPDAPARDALARLAARTAAETGAREVAPANLHLTLEFLGEVAPERVPRLGAAGADAAARAAGFGLRLDATGSFERARVAWIAPSVVPGPMAALQSALRRACGEAGFALEARPWAPHVTLARKLPAAPGARARYAEAIPLDAPIGFEVRDFVLMRSVSTPGGVAYRPIARFALPPAAPPSGPGERGG
jgi:2'-5' RNA ligase